MTSRVLFSKLFKDEMKRKIWIAVVVLLVMILAGPIALLMRYENYSSYTPLADMPAMFITFFMPSVERAIITVGIAILLGLTGFAYLFSKKQVDLYHSIPIKREKLFLVSYISGLVIYIGAYFIQIVTVLIAAASKGLFTNDIMSGYLQTIGGDLLHFFLIYHVTIVAVMLTGNLLVSIAATGVLLLYGLVVTQGMWYFSRMYFLTCSDYYDGYGPLWERIVPFFSPIASYLYFINYSNAYSKISAGEEAGYIIVTLLIVAALLALAVYLYKKRPSEAAGKALAYKKTESVIRILIVIPAATLGGMLFVDLNNKPESNWFWFGLILIGVLCHSLMEIIYRFDFKAFAGHKLQLICCLAVAVFIGLIYRQDLLGYDTYLPDMNKIQSASVVFKNVDNEMSSYKIDYIDENGVVHGNYVSKEYLVLAQSITDIASVYELGKMGVEQLNILEALNGNSDAVPIAKMGETESAYAYEEQTEPLHYTVRYTLNSDRTVYRTYAVDVKSAMKMLSRVYDSADYKEGAYSLLPLIDSNAFIRVEVYDILGEKQLSLTNEEKQEFLEIYKRDLMQLSAETLATQVPIARLNAVFRNSEYDYVVNGRSYEDYFSGYFIYPSFTETIAAMEKLGVRSEYMTTKINAEELEGIRVNDQGYLSEVLGMQEMYSEGALYANSETEDAALIEELCENMVNTNYTWSNLLLCPFEQKIEFELLYRMEGGIQRTGYAYMKKEQIPQKVIDDLVENAVYY